MKNVKHLHAALLGMLLSVGFSNPVSAVGATGKSSSGTADISATVPEFIVLHYYSGISLNFDTPSTDALNEGSNALNVSWQGEASGGEELAQANLMSAKMELEGSTTTVKLPNVWAVRGFSKSGTAKIEVTIPAGKETLQNGESSITISNVKVSDNTSTSDIITTDLNGIAKNKATFGSILMDLDFSKTNRSGVHSGGQYTITASTI
jgi:hypothetical protein